MKNERLLRQERLHRATPYPTEADKRYNNRRRERRRTDAAYRDREKQYRGSDEVHQKKRLRYATDPQYRAGRLKAVREWGQLYPDRLKIIDHRRRARLAAVKHTLTADQWEAILAIYKHRCAYCQRGGKMTMDHVIPLARGGEHSPENVVPACFSCNSRKQHRDAPLIPPYRLMI